MADRQGVRGRTQRLSQLWLTHEGAGLHYRFPGGCEVPSPSGENRKITANLEVRAAILRLYDHNLLQDRI